MVLSKPPLANADPEKIQSALSDWRKLLGAERVLADPEKIRPYRNATEGTVRRIAGVLRPARVEEVVGVVKIAARWKVPLYPVSTGHNWGYGSSTPPVDGCVIVDLSGMNRILEMNKKLGLLTVEPGVTQGKVHEYFRKHKLDFLAPINGAGPNTSLVGNALERGFGNLVPDIFSIVTSLQAVLPNGEIYRGAMTEMGGAEVDKAFKWGIGPYLDGIFSQGNFGIVTRMTFAVPPMPEAIEEFYFEIPRDRDIGKTIVALRDTFKSVGSFLCMVRILDPLRLIASVGIPYPEAYRGSGKSLPKPVVSRLCKEYNIAAWTGSGRMYGPKKVMNAARSIVKKFLTPLCGKLKFFSYDAAELMKPKRQRSGKLLPGGIAPSEVGMMEAYWLSGKMPKSNVNPAQDGCGIIWYAPVVPMKKETARAYIETVRKTVPRYGLNPIASLVITSPKYFYGITPILFDRGNPDAVARAQACYEGLFNAGKAVGLLPYRLPSHAVHLIVDPAHPFWALAEQLKKAVDPDGIISPGRYNSAG